MSKHAPDTSEAVAAFELEEFDPNKVAHVQPAPPKEDEFVRTPPPDKGQPADAAQPSFSLEYESLREPKEEFRLIYTNGVLEDDPIKLAQIRIKEAEDQAREAADRAKEMVQRAGSEAEAIRQKAYDEGYAQGQEDGLSASRARVEAALDNLNRSVTALNQDRAEALLHFEPEMVALVQACLDRIFITPNAVDPKLIRQVVAEAVRRVAENEIVTITVSPSDLELVKEFQPELLRRFEDLKRVKVQADPELHPGDCRVSSPTAQVEGGLAARRERICKLLDDGLRQGEALELSGDSLMEPEELDRALAAKPETPDGPEQSAEANRPEEPEDW